MPDKSGSGGTTNGTPAPYGGACTNCAHAKCRCIYRANGTDSGCERCHRLKKECVPSVSVRKRNGKRSRMSRAAQLEAKLEDLVTLLRNQGAPEDRLPSLGEATGTSVPSTSTSTSSTTTSRSTDSSPQPAALAVLPPPQRPDCAPGRCPVSRGSLLGMVSDPAGTAPIESSSIPPCVYQPDAFEAAEDLVTFRKNMLIFLPFVYLPPTMTSERLKALHPFLWFSVMTVTCKKVDRRLAMCDAVKKFLAHKMMVEHEKSLDLLLGLLVFLGWAHCYIKGERPRERPILTLVASLAKSLVYDLGLNKVPSEPYISACFRISFHLPSREKTLAERRAVLACFYLTSQISYSLKRLDALAWTPYMDECLHILSEQPEWEGDDLLVAQVKVQLIVDQLVRATSQSPDGIPPSYVLSVLRTQLHSVKTQLPPHLQQNDILLSHISYTELAMHEAALAKPPTPPLNGAMPALQRYEAMEGSLSAVKAWFDQHFSIPSYVYVGMTFGYWCSMVHCLLVLFRLSTVDDPAWDRRAVRHRIDLLAICDRLRVGFEDLAAQRRLESGPAADEDALVKFCKMFATMKANWAAELAALDDDANPGRHVSAATTPAEAFVANGGADGLNNNTSLFQQQHDDYPEAWIAGLFDINWNF